MRWPTNSPRQVEGLTPAYAEQPRRLGGFAFAIFGGAPGSRLAFGQIENCRAKATSGHTKECPAAGLLYVVAMRSNGKYVSRKRVIDRTGSHRAQ